MLFAIGGLFSCAPTLSEGLRKEAGPPVSFEEILLKADSMQGRVVILGGYILETENETDGSSVITVIQAPLDRRSRPKSQDSSKGRFLVRAGKFLDPEIYAKDRRLTVGGRITGFRGLSVGKSVYRYPVLEAVELHLWEDEREDLSYPYYRYHPRYDPWYRWGRHPHRYYRW